MSATVWELEVLFGMRSHTKLVGSDELASATEFVTYAAEPQDQTEAAELKGTLWAMFKAMCFMDDNIDAVIKSSLATGHTIKISAI